MGGDGGVIATQRRYLRGAGLTEEKDDGKNLKQQQVMRSCTCAQSCEKIISSEPIVACELGNIYKKEVILTALLMKTLNPNYSHIRGMKDLKNLLFSPNPSYSSDDKTNEASLFVCPVTQMEFNGIQPFVVIWSTGYVLSEKAIREIGVEGLQAEYGPFAASDIVKLIPTEEELPKQRQDMEARRAAAKAGKKEGKKKRSHEESTTDATSATGTAATEESSSAALHNSKKAAKAQRAEEHAAAAAAVGTIKHAGAGKIAAASSLAKQATETFQQQESKSSVFKSLFHKPGEADKKDRDLFMSVAGIRYTLK